MADFPIYCINIKDSRAGSYITPGYRSGVLILQVFNPADEDGEGFDIPTVHIQMGRDHAETLWRTIGKMIHG